jgi:hypothetical protein
MTVIAAIATVMMQASARPRMSEPSCAPPTMIAMPTSATTLASVVRKRGTSFSQTQPRAAVTNGPVAMMIATFETLVSCREGMKHTMPSVDSDATSQPVLSIRVKSRRQARPCSSTRMAEIIAAPNRPRQNRMVQESNGSSRVKNGAVLHATAAATTRAMPLLCCDCAPAIPLILLIAGVATAKAG